VLVTLIGSVPFGKVSVPFPVNFMIVCVLFIGVSLTLICCSCQIGCDDNSISLADGVVVVAVVLLLFVEAATGVIAILDAKIIANVKIVATVVVLRRLFYYYSC
jgi:hypothetical protein